MVSVALAAYLANAASLPDWGRWFNARDQGVIDLLLYLDELPISCTNSTPVANSCWFEYPGGMFVQTQFWDSNPGVGASDQFTLHGLWPDNCDGTYEQFCDSSLNIAKADVQNIVVNEFQDPALYNKIKANWNSLGGDDESLWVHEFNKHGTCVRTNRPECLASGKRYQNVYNYFKQAVALYSKYPTADFLAAGGIVPS